ncbi:kelch-like ECH-associated protein 1 [Lates japonicus]|uniref:Kelch-like ECH-associated protein 1 n=1 Tax=Lates japonicus TaxID=270547 RepID=A0AAD3N6T7_LATJO|nr:kelch-like ECH-associated protein 1 [Lates japonicus]
MLKLPRPLGHLVALRPFVPRWTRSSELAPAEKDAPMLHGLQGTSSSSTLSNAHRHRRNFAEQISCTELHQKAREYIYMNFTARLHPRGANLSHCQLVTLISRDELNAAARSLKSSRRSVGWVRDDRESSTTPRLLTPGCPPFLTSTSCRPSSSLWIGTPVQRLLGPDLPRLTSTSLPKSFHAELPQPQLIYTAGGYSAGSLSYLSS